MSWFSGGDADERVQGNILTNPVGFSTRLAGNEPKLNGQDTAGATGKDAEGFWSSAFVVCAVCAPEVCAKVDSALFAVSCASAQPLPDLSFRQKPHLRFLKASSAS